MESNKKEAQFIVVQNPYPKLFAMGKRNEIRGVSFGKKNLGKQIYLYVGKTAWNTEKEQEICKVFGINADELPTGAIFGRAVVKNCYKLSAEDIAEIKEKYPLEFLTGGYAENRWRWELDEIELLEAPISIKEIAHQGKNRFDESQLDGAKFIKIDKDLRLKDFMV